MHLMVHLLSFISDDVLTPFPFHFCDVFDHVTQVFSCMMVHWILSFNLCLMSFFPLLVLFSGLFAIAFVRACSASVSHVW